MSRKVIKRTPTKTHRQKVRGLLRHLDMVLREDNTQTELNAAKGWERPIFGDENGVPAALTTIRKRCTAFLYSQATQ